MLRQLMKDLARTAWLAIPGARSRHPSRLDHEHVAGGVIFLGLLGKIDPPRPEATARRQVPRRRHPREDDHR